MSPYQFNSKAALKEIQREMTLENIIIYYVKPHLGYSYHTKPTQPPKENIANVFGVLVSSAWNLQCEGSLYSNHQSHNSLHNKSLVDNYQLQFNIGPPHRHKVESKN